MKKTNKVYEAYLETMAQRYGAKWQYMLQRSDVKQELEHLIWLGDKLATDDFNQEWCTSHLDRVADFILCPATVAVGDGVTIRLWSDAHAATVTHVTATTVTVRQDKATLDPDWKPEFIVGGFAAHCTNQDEQRYTYEEDPHGHVQTFRWSKKYGTYGQPHDAQLTKGRHEFYDYNF